MWWVPLRFKCTFFCFPFQPVRLSHIHLFTNSENIRWKYLLSIQCNFLHYIFSHSSRRRYFSLLRILQTAPGSYTISCSVRTGHYFLGLKLLSYENNQSVSSNTKVKNEWIYKSTPSDTLMTFTEIALRCYSTSTSTLQTFC